MIFPSPTFESYLLAVYVREGKIIRAYVEPLMLDVAAATAMGARGRARVLAKFSLDAEAARIGEVYRPLL